LAEATRRELGRNDPCHCGSGKKYKQCHLDKDEAAARAARAKAAATAAPETASATAEATSGQSSSAKGSRPKLPTGQPWKRGAGAANTRGFQRTAGTRKVGGGG
jgi:hypothetical protein